MTTLTLTYYPDITQGQPAAAVHRAIEVFAGALAQQLTSDLDRPVDVTVADVLSVPDQYEHLLAGQAHVALMKPVAYVLAHARNRAILPACVAHRPIDGKVGTTYFAQIYARRDLGLRTLEDLAEHGAGRLTIAYGDRFSTSNFLIPASMLRARAGVHPFLFFRSVLFAGGHDLAAEAVYRGEADIGAGHDGAIKILGETHPNAADVLVQLGREDIHSDPVVVNTEVLPDGIGFGAVQSALTTIAKTEPVKESLDLFWGWVRDLSPTTHDRYASIAEALERLHLSEQDMLG